MRDIQDAAQKLGIQAQSLEVKPPLPDFGPPFETASKEQIQAIFVVNDPAIFQRAKQLADAALSKKLPTIYDRREYLSQGGLMSYGADLADLHRRAAGYVDKILKGAKPADLAVQPPTKLDFVVSQKTAQALGLTIPQSVLSQATDVLK